VIVVLLLAVEICPEKKILWHLILFKTRKAKIFTDTDCRIMQNKASTNINFIQQSYKHSNHFPKKLKYILYRQISYMVQNNFLLFNP